MSKKPNVPLVDKILLINSPIANVFEFLSNHENYIRWFPGVIAIESANSLPHGTVGKIYTETIRLPTGRNRLIAIEVVESRSPDLFTTEGTFAPVHPRMEVRLLEKSTEETVMSWRFFSRSQSVIGRFLIRALVKRTLARQSNAGLLRLKNILEEQARSAALLL